MRNRFNRFKSYRLMEPAGNPDGGGGSSGTPAGEQSNANGDGGQGGEGGNKPSEAEAKLLKEVMEKKEALKKARDEAKAAADATEALKAQLKQFEGLDLNKVKTLMEAEAKRAEEEALKRGEFDRLKAQMVEQHQAEVERLKGDTSKQLTELQSQLQAATGLITELTIGRAFGDSQYVRENLTLTPAKARVIYGSHFEIENGKVVAYDKPAGASERTKLVDGSGDALSFDKALEKLIAADPEKDHLIRSKVKPGAGSSNDGDGGSGGKPAAVGTGRERIAAALSGKTLFKGR